MSKMNLDDNTEEGEFEVNDNDKDVDNDEITSMASDISGVNEISIKNHSLYYGKCVMFEEKYDIIHDIHGGTYGVVSRAENKKTKEEKAIKFIKNDRKTSISGLFPITALREIQILSNVKHENIVKLEEIAIFKNNLRKIAMVMEFCDHDLRSLMDLRQDYSGFSQQEIKCLLKQLMSGVKYLHDHWIIHRDLKPDNLLLTNDNTLKICDFGMARYYSDPLDVYTPNCVTLWYRSPEMLILNDKEYKYGKSIDIWAVGCIMAELFFLKPLFGNANVRNEIEIINQMIKILGFPTKQQCAIIEEKLKKMNGIQRINNNHKHVSQPEIWRKFSAGPAATGSQISLTQNGMSLLLSLLNWNPENRILMKDALTHAWFSEMPLPCNKALIDTFPPSNKQNRQKFKSNLIKQKQNARDLTLGFLH